MTPWKPSGNQKPHPWNRRLNPLAKRLADKPHKPRSETGWGRLGKVLKSPSSRLDNLAVDFFSNDPARSTFSRNAGGILAPLVLAYIGLSDMIWAEGTIYGRGGGRLELSGTAAVAYGAAFVALALFVHCHFFWTASEKLCEWADTGKTISLCLFALAAGTTAWQILM